MDQGILIGLLVMFAFIALVIRSNTKKRRGFASHEHDPMYREDHPGEAQDDEKDDDSDD
ncbi:MAG: hypothetical protein ACQESV_07460 [Thermodesulfobacteriota bacterium]